MRRANYAVLAVLVGLLAGLGWWSLERFEQRDGQAQKLFNAAMFHWGNPNWQGLGDWPRAEAGFRQVLAAYPESQWSVQAAPYLVAALMNQRNDTAALAEAEYYAERYRGSMSEAQLLFQQGQCLKRLGRPADAVAALRLCRAWFPGTRAGNDAAALLAALPPVAETGPVAVR